MKYIIREGAVRGRGRYLATRSKWSIGIQPALWWPESMRDHAADIADNDNNVNYSVVTTADDAFAAERRKLAEMVGEGDE
ncbi:MAG TPA: hypothetical protein PLT98_04340 [Thauera aminoaromatica]|nr:hypothetical protein [Myxococcota bacterium]HMY77952.1 hypothetical protein [Thauera aminoaromatica]